MIRLLGRVKLISLLILEFSIYMAMIIAIYFSVLFICLLMDRCYNSII